MNKKEKQLNDLWLDYKSLENPADFELILAEHHYKNGFRAATAIYEAIPVGNLKFRDLWLKLKDIPVNNNGEIETPFLHFNIGTDREDIWHWLEDYFDICIGDILTGVIKYED